MGPAQTEARLVVYWSHITLVWQQYLVNHVDHTVVSNDTHGGHLGSLSLTTVDEALKEGKREVSMR